MKRDMERQKTKAMREWKALFVAILFLMSCTPVVAYEARGTDVLKGAEAVLQKDSVFADTAYFNAVPVEKRMEDSVTKEGKRVFEEIFPNYQSEAFNYDEDKRDRTSWWRRVTYRISRFLDNLLPDWNYDLQKMVYYTLVALGLLIFIYILYRIIINRKILGYQERSEEVSTDSLDWVEKGLLELNLDDFLERALEDKEYGLAIRYLHLKNLKKLAEKERIEWQYRKTHEEFLTELQGTALHQGFAQTMRLYEYIWYGDFRISGRDYQRYRKVFDQFNDEIR